MPSWSRKDERQYEHIKESELERGASEGIHSGCENLSLVVTPLSAVPCRHGHTSGIIIRPLGADPTRSAGLYSGA
jgi:hypothetical protein